MSTWPAALPVAEHLGAGVVVVRGMGTVEASGLIARTVHELRVKGTRLGPAGAAVTATLAEATRTILSETTTASPTGRTNVPRPTPQAGSTVVLGESLSTAQASALLGVCPRQVRRLDVGSSRVGGRLVWDRAAVEAEAARRAAATRRRRTT